jgi:hypothetical protein
MPRSRAYAEGVRGIVGLFAAATSGYVLVVRGALTLDLGVGRRFRRSDRSRE